jgi:hypothetical protein
VGWGILSRVGFRGGFLDILKTRMWEGNPTTCLVGIVGASKLYRPCF